MSDTSANACSMSSSSAASSPIARMPWCSRSCWYLSWDIRSLKGSLSGAIGLAPAAASSGASAGVGAASRAPPSQPLGRAVSRSSSGRWAPAGGFNRPIMAFTRDEL